MRIDEIPTDKSRLLMAGYRDARPWLTPSFAAALFILAGVLGVLLVRG